MYQYARCHMDALQETLDMMGSAGWVVHTIQFSGSLVHVLFAHTQGT